MATAVEHFLKIAAGLHIGRAHPSLLNGVKIEYYGSLTPLNQVASIHAANTRLLIVQPFDSQILPLIEKAIKQADLNLNPQKVGQTLQISIPVLTLERQQAISKHASQLAETQRVAIRNIRRDVKAEVKKLNIPEKNLDSLTAKYITMLDEQLAIKISEIKGTGQLWKP